MTDVTNGSTPATEPADTKVAGNKTEGKAPAGGKVTIPRPRTESKPPAKDKAATPAKGKATPAKTPRTPKVKEPVKYGEFEAHPAADLFPLMGSVQLDELAADISVHGQLEPILVFDNKILDGRNRYLACVKAGKTPNILTAPLDHISGQTATEWVISHNLIRRHLTTGQKAMIAVKLVPLVEAETKARESARKAGNQNAAKSAETTTADRPESSKRGPESADKAAALVGTSGRSVKRAQRITKVDPRLAERVETGAVSLDAAEQEIRGPESVVTTADRMLTDLWKVVRAYTGGDLPLREAFDWALSEDEPLRAALAELIQSKTEG